MRQLLLGTIVVCTAAAALAQQGQPAPQPPPPLTPGKAIVLGRVVEIGTTAGVANAVVRLTGQALGAPTAAFTDGTPGGPRQIVTDGDGRFVLRDLPAAGYNLTASAAGYSDATYGLARPTLMRRALDVVHPLDVSDADRPLIITLPMWRLGGVSGTARDEAGEPMAGLPIAVLRRTADASGTILTRVALVTTDDRGMYHVDVGAGDYQVAFFAPTTTVPATASDDFQRAMREGGDAQRAYMNGIVGNGGLLPRAYGTRMGHLLVSRFDNVNRPVLPPFTDASGRVFFYPSTFHPSSATADAGAIVTVGSGEEKAGINLDLRAVAMRRLSGRVIGPAGPMPSFVVRLSIAAPPGARSGPGSSPFDTSQAMTDPGGNFTFAGVAPGAYSLYAVRAAPSASEPALWAMDSVAVGETDVSGVTVTLQTGAQIAGRVVVDGAGTQLTAAQLQTITITVRPIMGTAALQPAPPPLAQPDASGRFTIRELVPGPYIVAIPGRLPAGLVIKSIAAAGRTAIDLPFDLTSSGVDEMVVALTDRITTLAGAVRDDTGQPASATVLVFPTDKSLWPPPIAGSRRLRTSGSGRDGRYSLRELPAGDYFVIALGDTDKDLSDPQVLAALANAASRVTLADGDSKTQDLRVTVIR